MSDLRIAMDQLTDDDKLRFLAARNEMRRTYFSNHADVLGMHNWDQTDDTVLDMLDLKLLTLFRRSGSLLATAETGKQDGQLRQMADEIAASLKAPAAQPAIAPPAAPVNNEPGNVWPVPPATPLA